MGAQGMSSAADISAFAAAADISAFAADDNVPIPYMAWTRAYYQAIGYETPYRWAHYTDAPFQPLRKPLAPACIAIVTTAAAFDPAKGDQGPGWSPRRPANHGAVAAALERGR